MASRSASTSCCICSVWCAMARSRPSRSLAGRRAPSGRRASSGAEWCPKAALGVLGGLIHGHHRSRVSSRVGNWCLGVLDKLLDGRPHPHARASHRIGCRTRGPRWGPRAHLRRRAFCARSSASAPSSAVLMSSAAARRAAQAASRSARSASAPAAPSSSAARAPSAAGAARGCAAASLAGGVCACGAGRAPSPSDTAWHISTLGGLHELPLVARRPRLGPPVACAVKRVATQLTEYVVLPHCFAALMQARACWGMRRRAASRRRACCTARNMASSRRRRAFSAASSAASPLASSLTTARVTICAAGRSVCRPLHHALVRQGSASACRRRKAHHQERPQAFPAQSAVQLAQAGVLRRIVL